MIHNNRPTSPIGFLFLKLPPLPCAVLLVIHIYIYILIVLFCFIYLCVLYSWLTISWMSCIIAVITCIFCSWWFHLPNNQIQVQDKMRPSTRRHQRFLAQLFESFQMRKHITCSHTSVVGNMVFFRFPYGGFPGKTSCINSGLFRCYVDDCKRVYDVCCSAAATVRRKFRSQTSDNMDRWKAEPGRGREKRKSKKKEDADAWKR